MNHVNAIIFCNLKAIRNIVDLSLSIGYENKASAPYMDENQSEENQIIHDEHNFDIDKSIWACIRY